MNLRPWRAEDATELAQQANDVRVWLNMRDGFPHPYGLDDAERFIAKATAMSPPTYFAIEVDSRVAGGIGNTLHADVERIAAEVGYWLGFEYWNRGVGSRARQERVSERGDSAAKRGQGRADPGSVVVRDLARGVDLNGQS